MDRRGEVPDHSLNILLISDHPDDAVQVMNALRPLYHHLQVRQASSEPDLADTIARGELDVALVEACLPWMDSLKAVRTIQPRMPFCPVIMIASEGSEQIIQHAIEAGLDGIVHRLPHGLLGLPAAIGLALKKIASKQAYQALQESEEFFRLIVEQSPISIQVITPDGWTVKVNRAWEKLWGVTTADVKSYNILKDEQAIGLGMAPYMERGFTGEPMLLPPVAYHTPESLKNGRKRWTQARIYPLKGKQNEIRNVIMMYEDITELQWATEDLHRLSLQLMNTQEAERKQISQELHEEFGQALTAMRINFDMLEKELPADFAQNHAERLAEIRMLLDETLDHTRELAHTLRPKMLDELGLVPTLRWYVNRYADRLGIDLDFEVKDLEERLAPEIETTLYRVIREALTNIARHAQARRVYLQLTRRGSRVSAWIEDDGLGFEVEQRLAIDAEGAGMGLYCMRERVALWGGTFTIHSQPGTGTSLYVELPLSVPLNPGER